MATASSLGRLPPRLHAPRAAVLYLALGWIAIGIYFLIPAAPQDILYIAIGVTSVLAIVVGSRRLGAERLAWRLFAAGLLGQVGGDMVTTVYELHLDREPPLPSLADVFYLGGWPPLALRIFLLLRPRARADRPLRA